MREKGSRPVGNGMMVYPKTC